MKTLSALIDYFKKVKLEFSKVAWLKPKQTLQVLWMVLASTILSACFFAVVDMMSSSLIMKIVFM